MAIPEEAYGLPNYEAVTAQERCTGESRWVPLSMMQAHQHKLQQAWEITEYRDDGMPVKRWTEWRDVPHVVGPQ
jgi:hypothetical protein